MIVVSRWFGAHLISIVTNNELKTLFILSQLPVTWFVIQNRSKNSYSKTEQGLFLSRAGRKRVTCPVNEMHRQITQSRQLAWLHHWNLVLAIFALFAIFLSTKNHHFAIYCGRARPVWSRSLIKVKLINNDQFFWNNKLECESHYATQGIIVLTWNVNQNWFVTIVVINN